MIELNKLQNSIQTFNLFKPRFSQSTHKEVEKQTRKLEELTLKVQENEHRLYISIDLESLFNALIKSITDKVELPLKNRELRAFAYNFGYRTEDGSCLFDSNKLVIEAFLTLNESWKNVYYFGLYESILKNWHIIDMNILKQLITVYLKKLKNEKNPSLRLKKIIQAVQFIRPDNGELTYAKWLTSNNIPLTNISIELGLKKSDLRLPYFANVLIEYAKLNYYEIIESVLTNFDLLQIFELHPNKDVHRLIVAHLILHPKSETRSDELKKIAYRVFGDTKTMTNWRLTGFLNTKDNLAIIFDAKKKLEYWITQSFITIFFEKCIVDEDRKRFWLQYSKEVEEVKIVGNNNQKYQLRYSGLDDYLDQRFIRTQKSDSNLAIVMEIKNFQIIEFSDKGAALYVYLKRGENAIDLENLKVFSSVTDLKKTYLPQLFNKSGDNYHYAQKEGRFPHMTGWEIPLSKWIQDKIGI